MHHTKNFSGYPLQKQIGLVALLVVKFALVVAVIVGLKSFLENYTTSPLIIFGIPHLVLLVAVIAYFLTHKRRAHQEHVHEAECNCK